MCLISNEYRALNKKLHEDRPTYGAKGGTKWAKQILAMMGKHVTTDVLDYGAGKQSLKGEIETVTSYDPAIPGIDTLPEMHDIVACLDVLEHIEPDRLEAVLLHIFSVTRKEAFFVVSTRPAHKSLADGRNAHLIVMSPHWWLEHIDKYFHIGEVYENDNLHEFTVYVTPRRKSNATPSKNYRPD